MTRRADVAASRAADVAAGGAADATTRVAHPAQPEPATPERRETDSPRSLIPSLWRLIIGMAVGLGVGVAVILIVNPRLASDVQHMPLASMEPVYLLLALACTAVVIVTDAWSLLLLARVFRPRIARRGVVQTALESHLIGGATSFGGFEIPYQIVMLRRGDLTGSQATSVVVLKGLVHTVLLAAVALVSLLPWVDSPITSMQRWLLVGAAGLLTLLWLAVWLWLRRPVGRSLVPERLHGKLDELIAAARAFGGAPRATIAWLFVLQTVYWVAMFSILLCVLYALGWRGPIAPIITGQAVMQVLMPLSPLPGGAGVAEFSYLTLIGPSTPESIHVSSLVLWRFFTWVIPVAVGAASLGLRGARHVA